MITTERVKKFAQAMPDLYSAFKEYAENDMAQRGFKNKKMSATSVDVMEAAINKEYLKEIQSRTGISIDNAISEKKFATNPLVMKMADDIRDYMIDMILPDTLLNGGMRYFCDFKFADMGDSMTFNLENNALYHVSKAGYRKRSTDLQKLYKTTATLVPENRMITVGTDLFEIMSGRVMIAREVMKAVRSIETAMYFDAYNALTTSMDAITATSLTYTNASEDDIITACQTVTAYNQGRKAVIIGTPVALKTILPTNANYRYLLDDDYVKLGYIQTFNNYDVIALEQVADPYNYTTPYSLKLADNRIHIVSPASDKLVKVGVGGEIMSHTDAIYDNANLLQLSTMQKAWDVQVITNSIAAVDKITG